MACAGVIPQRNMGHTGEDHPKTVADWAERTGAGTDMKYCDYALDDPTVADGFMGAKRTEEGVKGKKPAKIRKITMVWTPRETCCAKVRTGGSPLWCTGKNGARTPHPRFFATSFAAIGNFSHVHCHASDRAHRAFA